MTQQLAEVLGIAVEGVNPQVADTDSIGYTSNTSESGVAFKASGAAYETDQNVKRQLIDRATKIWEASSDDVKYVDGVIQHKSDSELKMNFKKR